jgi:hypothetical protein
VEADHGVHVDGFGTRVANDGGMSDPAPMSGTRPALLLAATAIAGCGLLSGPAAPEACGFPDGTVLEFAGRATTSALGLVEVADDPILSIEPADIYITRDQLTQGDHQGRLVCAIYVTQSGFTEITVHPDDLPPPEEPEAPAPRPEDGITRQEAVEVALEEVPEGEGWELWGAVPAAVSELHLTPDSAPWSTELTDDHWVWLVQFAREDVMLDVYVDYVDGSVLGTEQGIFN